MRGITIMAKRKDYTGRRFGKLVALKQIEDAKYGGRAQPLWLCQCDCGETIRLVNDQLPTTPLTLKTMRKSGRRLYDRCEECRKKQCPVCGDRFSYSHTSHVCPKDSCKHTMELERARFHREKEAHILANNPELKHRKNEDSRRRYHQNREHTLARRADITQSLTPEERGIRRSENRRRYREMMADPNRKAAYDAWRQEYRSRIAREIMLSDAAEIVNILEDDNDNEQ